MSLAMILVENSRKNRSFAVDHEFRSKYRFSILQKAISSDGHSLVLWYPFGV
jgi:hypothetical protein